MTKTDNEKYVKRGADMFIEYNPEWEEEVSHANRGKVGAPYRYSETLIMLAAALRVGLGIQYRQLEGTVGKMIGEPRTPSFSQLRKRMGRLDVSTYQGGMITVSDPKRSRILAADATGLKQHNRGEWMGKKWRVKRGFVKLHVMVDTHSNGHKECNKIHNTYAHTTGCPRPYHVAAELPPPHRTPNWYACPKTVTHGGWRKLASVRWYRKLRSGLAG